MNLKVMKTVVSLNEIRPVLSTIYVKNGVATATNLETTIVTKTNLSDGLYNTDGFNVNSVLINKKSIMVDSIEFPEIKTPIDLKINGKYDIKNLLKIIKISENYIGNKDNLAINGIRFENNHIITTNSYSMTMYKSEATKTPVTIPQGTITTLKSILSTEKTGIITMEISDNKVVFKTDNYTIISSITDLAFVDYENIKESVNNHIITRINRQQFVDLIKKHILVTKNKQESKYASLFNVKADKLELKSINLTTSIIDTVDCVSNEEIKIALNCKFIYDFISKSQCEYIQMKFKTNKSAVEICLELENGYLLTMPLSLREEK